MSLAHFKTARRQAFPILSAADANALDSDVVALALGLSIKHQGRHVELSNGIRGTNKGRMVWCQQDGTGIGDNLALAQIVSGLGFRATLELLLGQSAPTTMAVPVSASRLRIPRGDEADKQAGMKYLAGRSISTLVIDAAERCGMLRYISGAVLFVGYDGNRPASATRRGYLADDATPKRDLAGSIKAYPPILPGNLDRVWVVEGGADALALHTLYPKAPPTVIVSGGAGCREWLEQAHIQKLLKGANTVTVACDRETSSETQERTNLQHQKQVLRIQEYCPVVHLWMPPAGVKDVADLLVQEVSHVQN